MKYSLIQHNSIKGLNEYVNQAISRGWEPQGGVSVAVVGTSYFSKLQLVYCQAVVSRRDETSPIDGEREPTNSEPTLLQKIIGWGLTISFVIGIGWLLIHFFHKATS